MDASGRPSLGVAHLISASFRLFFDGFNFLFTLAFVPALAVTGTNG